MLGKLLAAWQPAHSAESLENARILVGHTNFATWRLANSIPPIFETSLFEIAVCNYRSINQLRVQSQILVSQIKVSFFQSG
jgi:hypothetical protein